MATGTSRRQLLPSDIVVRSVTVDNIEVATGQLYNNASFDINYAGFTPIAIAGHKFDAASDGGTGIQYVSVYRMDINPNTTPATAHVSFRNTHSSTIKVKLLLRVLYVRTIS